MFDADGSPRAQRRRAPGGNAGPVEDWTNTKQLHDASGGTIPMVIVNGALDKVRDRLGRRQADSQKNLLLKLLGELTGEPIDSVSDLDGRAVDRLAKKDLAKLAIRDAGKTTWVRQEDIEEELDTDA